MHCRDQGAGAGRGSEPDDFGLSKPVDSGVHSGPGLERLGCVGGLPPVVAPTGFESPKSLDRRRGRTAMEVENTMENIKGRMAKDLQRW